MSTLNVALAVQGSQKPVAASLVPVCDPEAYWASVPARERAIRGGVRYVLGNGKAQTLADVVAALISEAAAGPKKGANTGPDKAIPGVQPEPKRVIRKDTSEANRKQLLEPQALPAVVIMKKPRGKEEKIYVSKKVSMKDLSDHAEEYSLAMWCRTPAEAAAEAKKLEECRADNIIMPSTWPADKSPQTLTQKEIDKQPTEAEALNKIRRSDVSGSQVFGGPADMRTLDVPGQPPFKHRALVPEERTKPCGHAWASTGEVPGTGPRVCSMCGYREDELDKGGKLHAAGDGISMVDHYLVTALWSSNDESDPDTGGDPLDRNYSISDFAPEARQEAEDDCKAFLEKAGTLVDGVDPSQVGHDFWLTRNRHGAGFWDRPEMYGGKENAEKLTEIAHGFGEVNPWVAKEEDDAEAGKIYFE